jgi:hypothetical protein
MSRKIFSSLYQQQDILIHEQNTSENTPLFEQLHDTQPVHACY